MHFWIDKRSQCAYTGRHRVSSSLSSGVGRGRGRVCVGTRKGMAAPVHRFVSVDCPPRRPRASRQPGSAALPGVHARRPSPRRFAAGAPARPTIAALAAARSVTPDTLLRTAALGLPPPHAPPHLKLAALVSFALATALLAGAKYYFDRQVSQLHATVSLYTAALGLPPPHAPPHLKLAALVSFALATALLAGAKYYFDRQVSQLHATVSLYTAALGLPPPHAPPHLKLAALVSFALATALLAGAKYYFDRQVSQLHATVSLYTAALGLPPPHAPPHLKLAALVSFALATALLAGAKYYFDRQVSQLHATVSLYTAALGLPPPHAPPHLKLAALVSFALATALLAGAKYYFDRQVSQLHATVSLYTAALGLPPPHAPPHLKLAALVSFALATALLAGAKYYFDRQVSQLHATVSLYTAALGLPPPHAPPHLKLAALVSFALATALLAGAKYYFDRQVSQLHATVSLYTAALGLPPPHAPPHLKLAALVSFALATALLAGAKYYFDRQVSQLHATVSLYTAALGLPPPHAPPHLKLAALVSFALATALLAGAKYYFDRQVSQLHATVSLYTAALGLPPPHAPPHLKLAALVSFALATALLAGAKYYFDRQVSQLHATVSLYTAALGLPPPHAPPHLKLAALVSFALATALLAGAKYYFDRQVSQLHATVSLYTAALGLPPPHAPPHLKLAALVSFALATALLAGAKYYFDRQVVQDNSRGGEVNVVVAAVSMACVCGVGCALSLCRAPPAPPRTPERVSSTARRAPPAPPAAPAVPGTPPAPEAPPPYHIAVLLPPPSPPPPAYSALS